LKTLIYLTALVFLFSQMSYAENNISFKFKNTCSIVSGEQGVVNIFTILKLKGSKSQKVLSLSCLGSSKKCYGAELHLSDENKSLSELDLTGQNYEPQKINLSKSIATVIYYNTTMTVDTNNNTIRMVIDFEGKNPVTEIWEGSCK
jgi:hypothetical protein